MFTGEWDDARTPRQQQRDAVRALAPGTQTEMFSPFLVPSEPRGQERNGTHALVDQDADHKSEAADLAQAPDDDGELEEAARLQRAVYYALIQLCEEEAATLWIDPLYEGRYTAQIEATVLEGRTAGLSNGEIAAAIQIGQHRGNVQRRRR